MRKRCKRVRALLRLVRPGLDAGVYTRENRTLRDAARVLSDVRDAKVRIDTYDRLVTAGAVPVDDLRASLDDQVGPRPQRRAGRGARPTPVHEAPVASVAVKAIR